MGTVYAEWKSLNESRHIGGSGPREYKLQVNILTKNDLQNIVLLSVIYKKYEQNVGHKLICSCLIE